ncbi:NAD(P)-dependent oxidoreductase [Acetobacter sp. TBRC 12305]|uniref:NAD(P)-dependent oxidoreductase n=1 Tax=Acetobacter garciniae TaxID=2817435 RepID=A0A939HLY0_9PROT|nr:NAD(P)-dependent oxidoreductase [Acetobacter garciniae]MBO1323973.1 NAD(P)-dependent oxidoreductase [Acetobacter garciniae]MBX0343662.1 NAD(P)-dependent oxidoreductase [Acetobacter garciniae]
MRVMVTGARGILGRHVCRHLGNLSPASEIIISRADLTSLEDIRQEIAEIKSVDCVIHLAALTPVERVNADPQHAYSVNVAGTINLLSALSGIDASFLFCSSSHVYSGSSMPINEYAEKVPVSLYGRTKWAAESAATDICHATGRPFCAARVFSIHDPDQVGSFLRPSIERRLSSEDLSKPFLLQGGESVRDFLPAERAAELIVRLVLASATGPVNIGSGYGTRIRDFVQKLSPQPLEIHSVGNANTLVADISRLREILGALDV